MVNRSNKRIGLVKSLAILCTVAIAALASSSTAQAGTWAINVSNPLLGPVGSGLPQQTVVTVSAILDAGDFAFAAGEFDFVFSEGNPGVNWINNQLLAPLNFDPVPAGTAGVGRLENVRPGQLHFPAAAIIADSSDPIAAWEVTYVATDFSSSRTVNLSTLTDRFDAYLAAGTATSATRAAIEAMGSFQIQGIPEPTACTLALLATLFAMNRRRR